MPRELTGSKLTLYACRGAKSDHAAVNRRLLDSSKTASLRVIILLGPCNLARGSTGHEGKRHVRRKRSITTYSRTAAALTVGLTALLAACYPSPPLDIEDLDTVITVRTEGSDFSGFRTYAVPDTILSRPDTSTVSPELTALITGEIRKNMEKLGYEESTDPENDPPDVVVIAGAISRAQFGAWLGYPFIGGWQWYVGGPIIQPPVNFNYLYTLGTVTMDMVDYKNVDPENIEYSILWTAAVSGPLQQDKEKQTQRIVDGIERAFAQSPYLAPQ